MREIRERKFVEQVARFTHYTIDAPDNALDDAVATLNQLIDQAQAICAESPTLQVHGLFRTPEDFQEVVDWIERHPPGERAHLFTAAMMTWNYIASKLGAKVPGPFRVVDPSEAQQ